MLRNLLKTALRSGQCLTMCVRAKIRERVVKSQNKFVQDAIDRFHKLCDLQSETAADESCIQKGFKDGMSLMKEILE